MSSCLRMHKASKTAVLINTSEPPRGCVERNPQSWSDPPLFADTLSQTRPGRSDNDRVAMPATPPAAGHHRGVRCVAPRSGSIDADTIVARSGRAIAPATPPFKAGQRSGRNHAATPGASVEASQGRGSRPQRHASLESRGQPRPAEASQPRWIQPRPDQSGRGSSCTCLPLKPGPAARPPAPARPPRAPSRGTGPPAPGSPPRSPGHR